MASHIDFPNNHPKKAGSRRRGKQAKVIPIESRILILRRQRVVLDSTLAELYGVSVKRLNQQVKRNRKRFPADFMFQLTAAELPVLRLQIATSNVGRGGRRFLPYAFTEHGVIMAAAVLNSERAVKMSIRIVRTFVRLRQLLATDLQLAAKIEDFERRLDSSDDAVREIFRAIKRLLAPKPRGRRVIGFRVPAARSAAVNRKV